MACFYSKAGFFTEKAPRSNLTYPSIERQFTDLFIFSNLYAKDQIAKIASIGADLNKSGAKNNLYSQISAKWIKLKGH